MLGTLLRTRALRSATWFIVACMLAPGTTLAAAAGDVAGRVVVASGGVEAVGADGVVRTLRRRDEIYRGDTLRSGDRGRAQVRFTDGALLSLRPDSELSVQEYRFENSDATDRKALRLERGGFRTISGRIGRVNRDAYRVSTPVAVIGIRGTDWQALQEPDGGPLLLGVADGGLRTQTTAGASADIGADAGFDFARVNPDGSIELLLELPAALGSAAAVDEVAPADSDDADADGAGRDGQGADGQRDGEGRDGQRDGDGQQQADARDGAAADSSGNAQGEAGRTGGERPAQEGDGGDARARIASLGGGGGGGGGGGVGGGGGGGGPPPAVAVAVATAAAAGVSPAQVADAIRVEINPANTGSGLPPTREEIILDRIRVFLAADEAALRDGTTLAAVAGARRTATGATFADLGLAAATSGTAGGVSIVLLDEGTPLAGARQGLIDSGDLLYRVRAGDVTTRVDAPGGATGVTFASIRASASAPLRTFTNPADDRDGFDLATPLVFALFDPASVASLTGTVRYALEQHLTEVSTGAAGAVLGDVTMSLSAGSGTISRGVLDVSFGATPGALAFVSDFRGTVSAGQMNAVFTNVVLNDNRTSETFSARGDLAGRFAGGGAAPDLVVSFDFADTAGRNEFARGVATFGSVPVVLPGAAEPAP
jgi:hypothetical protein